MPVSRPDPPSAHWLAFALLCTAYLAVTVGEALLSPVFPTAAEDLDLDLQLEGIAFGVLTASIAVTNLIGGQLLARLGIRRLLVLGSALTTAGAVVAATAGGFLQLAGAQVLIGAGAGISFPAGLAAVGLIAGPRKGFAMGLYGVAFSAGLTVAALLGSLGATHGWRVAFVVAAGVGVAAIAATLVLTDLEMPSPDGTKVTLRQVLGLPTMVGSVGAVCQYGAVPFLPTFAVEEWHLSAGAAAGVLAAGRVISIVAKLISGAGADRVGPRTSARRTGWVLVVTGVAWVLLPGSLITYALAAVFAGTISSLFPVANMLAVEQFGQRGGALGMYRSIQIGFGALVSAAIGVVGHAVGLQATLLVAVSVPLLLQWLCREPVAVVAPAS